MASLSQSRQRSQQQSSGSSFVDPNQQPFLDFLRSSGQGIAQGQLGAGGVGDAAAGLSASLGGSGNQFLQSLLGQAQGGGNPQLSQAIGQGINGTGPGADFLQQRLSQENPFLNQQIANLGQDIGQQFQDQILPGIRRDAVSVGGLGGARQGIAEGQAAEGVTRQFAQQAGQLRAQDVALRQAAAQQLQQGSLAAGGLAAQQGAQGIAAAGAGLGSLGGLFDLGVSPFGAQFAPLQALAGIIGGPTVLSEQQSQGSGSGQSGSVGFGSLFTG